MNRNWIRKAHRWIGLAFSLTAMMSAGSGVLHTIMTRTQSAPPPARPSGAGLDAAAIRTSVGEAVAELPAGTTATAVNIRMIGGQPWYQIFTDKDPVPLYASAVDGHADPAQDGIYAGEIATSFLNGQPLVKTDYLTKFNNEYINIFRILPVHRFDADDAAGTRLYVSTTTGSVTRYTDNERQFEASAFTNFHKLGFIPNKDVRDWVQIITTGSIFVISLLGIVLFFMTRPKRRSAPVIPG